MIKATTLDTIKAAESAVNPISSSADESDQGVIATVFSHILDHSDGAYKLLQQHEQPPSAIPSYPDPASTQLKTLTASATQLDLSFASSAFNVTDGMFNGSIVLQCTGGCAGYRLSAKLSATPAALFASETVNSFSNDITWDIPASSSSVLPLLAPFLLKPRSTSRGSMSFVLRLTGGSVVGSTADSPIVTSKRAEAVLRIIPPTTCMSGAADVANRTAYFCDGQRIDVTTLDIGQVSPRVILLRREPMTPVLSALQTHPAAPNTSNIDVVDLSRLSRAQLSVLVTSLCLNFSANTSESSLSYGGHVFQASSTLISWCGVWKNATVAGTCSTNVESRSFCVCPYDRTGKYCELSRAQYCSVRRLAPRDLCRESSVTPTSDNPNPAGTGFDLYEWPLDGDAPCVFVRPQDSWALRHKVQCRFAENNVQEGVDPAVVASLQAQGYSWNSDYTRFQFPYATVQRDARNGRVVLALTHWSSEVKPVISARLYDFTRMSQSDKLTWKVAVPLPQSGQVSSDPQTLLPSDLVLDVTIPALIDSSLAPFLGRATAGGRMYMETELLNWDLASRSVVANQRGNLYSAQAGQPTAPVARLTVDIDGWVPPPPRPATLSPGMIALVVILPVAFVLVVGFFVARWWWKRKDEEADRALTQPLLSPGAARSTAMSPGAGASAQLPSSL